MCGHGGPSMAVKADRSSKAVALPTAAKLPLLLIVLGWLAMYVPSYYGLANTIWKSDAQGHGPIILAVGLWLLYGKRGDLARLAARPAVAPGVAFMVVGLVAYVLGRSQTIWTLEIGSQIFVLVGVVLLFFGFAGTRIVAFPIFFLIFMVPWPADWVDALTGPLKAGVSSVATSMLYQLGYPVGRSGVIITVGPYQLLVADACAGLNSMFTLEALGLLYMNLMQYQSKLKNALIALLIIPISFLANVIRVVILVLVTYHLGDEAGQGFVHGFAGMVLFLVALAVTLAVDGLLSLFIKEPMHKEAAPA